MKVSAHIKISRPTSDVFAFISNFANDPKWRDGLIEAYFITDPPVRPGSEHTQVARFLGRTSESTFKVIAYEPGRLIKATTIKSTFPLTLTRLVEPAEHGCSITAIIEVETSGLFKLAEPLLAKKLKSDTEQDYATLKSILEKK